MKPVIVILLSFVSIWASSQNDTLKLKPFVKTDSSVATLMIQSFDSILDKTTPSSTFAQILQNHSSVYVKSYSNSGLASISLRGTGASHTTVFFEDLPVNSPMNGQIDFNVLPITFFDNLTLTVGNASLKNSSGGIGGALELNNTLSQKNTLRIHQSAGSFENYATAISTFFHKKKFAFDTRLFYQNATNNFIFQTIDAEQNRTTHIADNSAFVKYGAKQRIYYQHHSFKSFIDILVFNTSRELTPALNTSSDESQDDNLFWAVAGVDYLHKKTKIKNRAMYQHQTLRYLNPAASIESFSEANIFQNALSVKHYPKQTFTIELSSLFQYSEGWNESYGHTISRIVSDNKIQWSYRKKNWHIDLLNRSVVWNNTLFGFIPYFGISKKIWKKRLLLSANVSKNLHLPTLNDLYWTPGGNPDLQPEQGTSVETAVSAKLLQKQHISANVALQGYFGKISNWILWHPVANYWQADNIKNVENKGIEVNTDISVKKDKQTFSLQINYAYNSVINQTFFDNNNASVGKQLIYVPYHTGAVNFIFIQKKKYEITYSIKYTGKRYITTDNSWYLPANYINNIGFNRLLVIKNHHIKLSFNVLNLFNQPYQMVANRPMPGRYFNFSISIKI